MSSGKSASGPALRPGDVVEVRPAAEILATLGRDGALKGMPFMPEMLAHVGRRYTVTRRVDKICNMVDESGSRRMRDTVYLADLRCDGSRHGGCQAGCKIYWKEAWLRRVDDGPLPPETGSGDAAELDRVAEAATKANRPDIWRCQATEALKASEPLKRSDLRQYWREATNGNFGRLRLAGLLIRAFVMECAFHLGVVRPLPLQGPGQNAASGPLLNLQPGEIVEVRAPKEIEATLDRSGHNRGLSFDREMLPLCGRTFRVRQKVRRIIDESTGRMLTIPKDCVILEGAACTGERSVGRWFCPREIYPFWRESWLKRVDDQELHHSGPRLPKPDREAIDSESQLESGGRH